MNKMSKDFKNKSSLRCMADGGMLGNATDKLRGRANAIDNAEALAVAGKRPTTAQPAPTPPPQGGMISDGVVSRPAPVAQPQPQPSLFSRLRRAVGMANGGSASPWAQEYASGTLGSATPAPKPVKPAAQLANAISGLAAQRPVTTPNPIPQPAGPAESTGGLAPAVAVPTAPSHSIATASTPIQTGDLGAVGDGRTVFGEATPQLSKSGYPMLRTGGYVRGPGGPREDKVGPVMLSDKEYVLPAKTVQAMGGPETLDEVVQATNDGRKPRGADKRDGLRGFATGGAFYVDEFGNVSSTPKSVPATVPPAATPRPPVIAVQPNPGPEIDVTPPRQSGFEAAKDVTRDGSAAIQDAEKASRLRSAARGTAKFVNKWVAPAMAADSLYDTYKTPTEDYYTRFGINPKADSNIGQFAKDVGVRALGAASDLGDYMTGGIVGQELYRDKQPKPPVKTPVNPWARDARDVAPDSTLIAEDRARQPGQQYLTREGVDTGGAVRSHERNVFYGGTMGEEGRRLQDIETQRGLARYKQDAEGMYASIQARVASGDLETAAKLAWDPASRAIVERGYADRMNARAAAAAGNDQEGAINRRYDKRSDELRRYFSSDRAKGNLAKHLDQLEGQRGAELGNLRNVNAQMRGQDMASSAAAARQASEQAIAAQRAVSEQAKMQMDQSNKDREFALNKAKYGTEVAKAMFEQKEAHAAKVQDAIDKFSSKNFVTKDGKPDLAQTAAFNEFLHGSAGDIHGKSLSELNKILSDAMTRFRVRDRANANRGWISGTYATDYAGTKEVRPEATISDVVNGGLGVDSYAASKIRKYTFGNPEVREDTNNQVRLITSLTEGDEDQKALEETYGPLRRRQ